MQAHPLCAECLRSLPVRGAWIEIHDCRGFSGIPASLPVRGAWIEMRNRNGKRQRRKWSLPVRGAWIEIKSSPPGFRRLARRSPCGERGLKFERDGAVAQHAGRSPCGERGLKFDTRVGTHLSNCRSPCGERGLKLAGEQQSFQHRCRSPCGERGLKSNQAGFTGGKKEVAPRAGSVD